jgi:leucyl aminopeptidase
LKNSFLPQIEIEDHVDLWVLPFWHGSLEACSLGIFKEGIQGALKCGDFHGKLLETLIVYWNGKRILLLGLGKEKDITVEALRKAYAQAVSSARKVKGKIIHLLFPKISKIAHKEALSGMWEGMLLSNYAFPYFRHDTLKDCSSPIESAVFIGLDSKDQPILDRLTKMTEGVNFARDLVNGNADDVTPRMLADTALSLEKIAPKIKTKIYDKKWLEKEKMGLILAVNRASAEEPYLIEVSYRGNPSSEEHIVLVGKGVTYDTGGLSLKPTDGMLTMKMDMAGAAAVLGTIRTAALLEMKVNVTVLVPTVENSIDALSYKLGDVYRSYSGKTVEINNTDAEGRLILADALSYAVKHLKPTYLIDVATLTGAVVVALGEQVAGFCSNDDLLSDLLLKSSKETSENLCRLPLVPDYVEAFKSDIADLTNSGGRDAGSIKGALFLQEFIGSAKWAHLDIAGAAYWSKPKYYHPTRATGYGVRLLVEFLGYGQS